MTNVNVKVSFLFNLIIFQSRSKIKVDVTYFVISKKDFH